MTQPTNSFPVLPLRDIVVFPHMIVPLFVGRDKSVRALEDVMQDDKQILLAAQKNAADDDPGQDDIYGVGTISTVLQLLKLPDGTVKVLVEGSERAKITHYHDNPDFFQVDAETIPEIDGEDEEHEALSRSVIDQFEQYVKLNKKIPPEVLVSVNQIENAAKLADTVASHLALKISEKQELLETASVAERLERVFSYMEAEIGVLQVEKKIRNRVKRQMEKTQREYYLNEQLKAIQKELGETDDGRDEAAEIEEKINKTKLSKEAKEKSLAELKKFKSMSPMSAEATVVRNYLDWMLSIPWKKRSRIKTNKVTGPILCLVGPPGVGKTSLGKSVARSTGRNFVRMSLGGVRDESEIRGHRRTYIGSMPGKIIQGMKKAKSSNPLFLLDEVDKMGNDWRGDPASALLEVLDPEQNNSFNDHYLEVDYDLSDVMFLTTANTLNMPPPLLDRMEIIRLSGYTEDEKVEIANRHLIPKQIEKHGIKEGEWTISNSGIREVIRYYTKESGVRNLERELANLIRKAVKEILMEKAETIKISKRNIVKYLGVKRFRFGEIEQDDLVGVTTGLAWTEVGGELLNIEAVMVPGKGKMTITGKLGDVMTESIQAAKSFVQSRAVEFGIEPPTFSKKDIHVHVPEGATPKDGPSAGVAMVTSIVSVLTGVAVNKEVAMTGEVTLRGRVLPIGGLKEKLLAAHRGGIKTVLIPKDNEKDLAEIPDNVKRGLKIIPVSVVDEVLERSLVTTLTPIEWDEDMEVDLSSATGEDDEPMGLVKH